jgi:carbon monoxide dehydrogenase subunit G
MRLEGSHTFDAPVEMVWATLLDPATIARCMPGCERFEQIGPDHYEASMRIGIGPIKGSATGRIRLADQEPPHRYRMEVEGGGAPGHATGSGLMSLRADNGRTIVSYAGDLQVTGKAASVGQRLLGATAKLLINQFFKCMESKIGT